MSDEDLIEDGDEDLDEEDYVAPAVPSGYIPGLPEDKLPAGQSVEERGTVVPSPEEINDLQREAMLQSTQEGGAGSPGSPDTAAAGAEHEDR